MLYIFDEMENLDCNYLSLCAPYLSEERRKKVRFYRFELDKKLSAAAYMLLRYALMEEYGIEEPIDFMYNTHGKPFLEDYPGIYFNLSHCAVAVACIVSETEAGVDVQEITPVTDGIAKMVLNAREYEEFKAYDNPFELFCKYWTIKESLLKRVGRGITDNLTGISAENAAGTALFKGNTYFCCAAVNPDAPVNIQAKRVRYSKEAIANGSFFS